MTFLSTVFEGLPSDEICVVTWPKNNSWVTIDAEGVDLEVDPRATEPRSFYFCISSVVQQEGARVRRSREHLAAVYVLMLDDIGTKVDIELVKVGPSYRMETSEGNYQYGYLMERCEDIARFEAFVEVLKARGLTDKGAGGAYRVARTPGSVHKTGWRAKVNWLSKKRRTLDELMAAFEVTDEQLLIKRPPAATAVSTDITDPVLTWLSENERVVADRGTDWVDIICPNHAEHTSPGDTAGYSPLGRGGAFAPYRSFKCMHEHCQAIKGRDFLDLIGMKDVPAYDPVTFLQTRYAVVLDGQLIADLAQRRFGGKWLWTAAEFAWMHPGKVKLPGRDRTILIANAFIEHPETRRFDRTYYWPPACGEEVMKDNQVCLNTYVPPHHPDTDEEPELFLEHLEYLLEDPEPFLDWLAHKAQRPGERAYGMCWVASGQQGIGRSMVTDMLKMVFRDVATVSFEEFIGRGSKFNGWQAETQFVFVGEAKAVDDAHDRWTAYDTVKDSVDTRPTDFECNRKYGGMSQATRFYNALVTTNYGDAMIFDEDDRRWRVDENPGERQSQAYYERMWADWSREEAHRVWHHLLRRDVSKRDIWPEMTKAKIHMISSTRTPADEIDEYLVEHAKGDLFTRVAYVAAFKAAARHLDVGLAELVVAKLAGRGWRQLEKLADHRNGLRFDGANRSRIEVKAVKNVSKWHGAPEKKGGSGGQKERPERHGWRHEASIMHHCTYKCTQLFSSDISGLGASRCKGAFIL